MKKTIYNILTVMMIFFLSCGFYIVKANASSASITLTPSKYTVAIGTTFTVRATISSSANIGSWDFTINYDTSKLTMTGSDAEAGQHAAANTSVTGVKSVSYTFTFKAKAAGTANVKVNNATVADWDTTGYMSVSLSGASKNISILTQAQIQASYSTNNNLSSLGIDGATLSPAFSAGVLSYTAELLPETTKVNVTATKADVKAGISGIGEVTVVDGVNNILIVVTAENGTAKTYTIVATVKELNPITVKTDGKTYTIARKKGLYDAPTNFEQTTVKIDNEDVLAYLNKDMGYYVLGLKDSEGVITKYIYNPKDKTYTIYKDVTVGTLNLYLKPLTDKTLLPDGFRKTSLKIGKVTFDAWHYKNNNNFYLINGVDTKTGDEDLYLYDKAKATIQRFYNEPGLDYKDQLNHFMIIAVAAIAIALAFAFISIVLVSKLSKANKGLVPKIDIIKEADITLEDNDNKKLKKNKKNKE